MATLIPEDEPIRRTITIGNAPVTQSGTGGQWAAAWTNPGVSIVHKADILNGAEAWTSVKLTNLLSQSILGGDMSAGDLGVSGQSMATSANKQEVDGREALRFNLAESASSVTIDLSQFFANDDGTGYSESGRVRLFDAGGNLVGESFFHATGSTGTQSIQVSSNVAFRTVEISAGAMNGGTFVFGGYANADGSFGSNVVTDAAGKLHGSDFLLDKMTFELALPNAAADSYALDEDQVLAPIVGVLGNDTDPDNVPLSAVLVAGPGHGALTFNADGTFVYLPDADFNGVDSFTYRAFGGNDYSTPTQVSLVVRESNDAPLVTDDSAAVAEDSSANLINALANDKAGPANESAQQLSITAAAAAHGQVTVNADGNLLYTPNFNFFGTDTISYTATDNGTTNGTADPRSSAGTINVVVSEVNDAPSVAGSTAEVKEDSTENKIDGFLKATPGPSNESGQHLAIVSAEAEHGDVTFNSEGFLIYTPDSDYFGPDRIRYLVTDDGTTNGSPDPLTDLASVEVMVAGVNDAPVAADDSGSTNEDTQLIGNVLTGANGGLDTDADGDALTVTTVAATSLYGATVSFNTNGAFTYDPTGSATLQALGAGSSKVDTFTYSISDGHGGSDSATVSVTVAGRNEPSNNNKVISDIAPGTDLDYYIRFEGSGLTGEWLRLESFSTGLEGDVLVGPDGLPRLGRVNAVDLQSLLGTSDTVVDLTKALLSGAEVKSVEIEAYRRATDQPQLVEEFEFRDVRVTGLDTQGSWYGTANDITFDFGALAETVFERDGKGGLLDKYEMAWGDSFVTDGTAEAAKAKLADGLDTSTELRYYLHYDGAPGWLELSSFSMGLDVVVTSGTKDIIIVGEPTSTGVELVLGASEGLLELVQTLVNSGSKAGSGMLSNVEIEAYINMQDKGFMLVDEYRFDEVQVTDWTTSNGTYNTLNFVFNEFSHAHDDPYSTAANPEVGYDFAAGNLVNPPNMDAGYQGKVISDIAPGTDLDYYIRFEGSGLTGEWLRLESFSTGLEGDVLVGPDGLPRLGRVNAVDLQSLLGTSDTVVDLTKALLSGAEVKSVEIEAYRRATDQPQLVEEFEFRDVRVTGLDTQGSWYGTANDITFDFGALAETVFERDGKGGLLDKYEMAWGDSFVTDGTAEAAKAKLADGLDTSTELRYYLHYDGAPGWLELSSFSMGLDVVVTSGTKDIIIVGEPTSTGVELVLGASEGLLELVQTLVDSGSKAGSGMLSNVEIEAYINMQDKGFMLVDEYRFDEVQVTDWTTSNGTYNTLNFVFNEFSHAHDDPYSTAANPEVGYDFAAGNLVDPPNMDAGYQGKVISDIAPGTDLDYYIRFEGSGLTGEWLRLESFSTGLEGDVLVGPDGLPRLGRVNAVDLQSLLGTSDTVVDLTKALLSGAEVKSVEIEAYRRATDQPQLVEEFEFRDVRVTGLDTQGSWYGTANDITFDFGALAETVFERDGKGGLLDKYEMAWGDSFVTDGTAEAAKAKLADGLDTSTELRYYLHYDGAPGWLELSSFSMGLDVVVTSGTKDIIIVGEPTSTGVELVLGASEGLLELVQTLVDSGSKAGSGMLSNVEIEAYINMQDKGFMLVDEYRFDEVQVTDWTTSNGTYNTLNFVFNEFSHAHDDPYSTAANPEVGYDFAAGNLVNPPNMDADIVFF